MLVLTKWCLQLCCTCQTTVKACRSAVILLQTVKLEGAGKSCVHVHLPEAQQITFVPSSTCVCTCMSIQWHQSAKCDPLQVPFKLLAP